ncbi:chaplin family protein [Actinokineospora sp. NPDC004072]
MTGFEAQNTAGVSATKLDDFPLHLPVNLCGKVINIASMLNPGEGQDCLPSGGGGPDYDPQQLAQDRQALGAELGIS